MTSDWAISTLHSLLDHRVSIRFKASARYALGVTDSDCSGYLDASPFHDGLRFRLLSDRPTLSNAVTLVPFFDPHEIEIEEIALLLLGSAQPECVWNAAHPTGRDLPRGPESPVLAR
jgi:hypothetical protein